MTPEAQKICTMLEAVNDDTAVEVVYDEINCRIHSYLYPSQFVRMAEKRSEWGYPQYMVVDQLQKDLEHLTTCHDRDYINDRNLLNAVRDVELEGWVLTRIMENNWNGHVTTSLMRKPMADEPTVVYNDLHTETIAELHAIIQAIDWKRDNA